MQSWSDVAQIINIYGKEDDKRFLIEIFLKFRIKYSNPTGIQSSGEGVTFGNETISFSNGTVRRGKLELDCQPKESFRQNFYRLSRNLEKKSHVVDSNLLFSSAFAQMVNGKEPEGMDRLAMFGKGFGKIVLMLGAVTLLGTAIMAALSQVAPACLVPAVGLVACALIATFASFYVANKLAENYNDDRSKMPQLVCDDQSITFRTSGSESGGEKWLADAGQASKGADPRASDINAVQQAIVALKASPSCEIYLARLKNSPLQAPKGRTLD